MAASEGKADVFRFNFGNLRLNVRFSPKRTFKRHQFSDFDSPLSAISGHAIFQKHDLIAARIKEGAKREIL